MKKSDFGGYEACIPMMLINWVGDYYEITWKNKIAYCQIV
jgi:hypothetical protein